MKEKNNCKTIKKSTISTIEANAHDKRKFTKVFLFYFKQYEILGSFRNDLNVFFKTLFYKTEFKYAFKVYATKIMFTRNRDAYY